MTESGADVDGLVADLTREEKLRLVRGRADPEGTATGYLPGVERLGVPEFRLVDGPLGVRAAGERSTAFPASMGLAATFDPGLGREQGEAMAREARAHGQDVLLAPGVNVVRVSHCGRNFEYFSEDPHLASAFAASVVRGIEGSDADVLATVKHYVANNQEADRTTVSAEVDERTLRELYLRPFRGAVEAGVGSVMTAYNRVNGTHMSDHSTLVGDVLKGEWGFEGFAVSDWYGLESTVGAATAGLDLEMPGVADPAFEAGPDGTEPEIDFDALDPSFAGGLPDPRRAGFFGDPLDEAIERGDVPAERLDDMVRRVLRGMDRVGLLVGAGDDEGNGGEGDGVDPQLPDREGALDTPEHRELAERIATRGTVLLENDGILPLDDDADVAVIGPSVERATLGGGGSSETTPFRSTAPREGIEGRAGGEVRVARGVEEVEDVSLFDLLPGDEEREEPDAVEEGDADEVADRPDPSIEAAVAAARESEVALVFVRDASTEARDRESLSLPGDQDELVQAVADANDRTVAVVASGGPIELPWRESVAAVVETWYPGQAHGDAVTSVLYGDRDPSGRLPVTFAPERAYPTDGDERRYPGVGDEAHYGEGVFVGYRHFDAAAEGRIRDEEESDGATVAAAEPTYPFGHGESYAEFRYGEAEAVDESSVRVTVENAADRPGREVVQAYVRPPETTEADGAADVERPVRELAGVAAVELPPGGSRTVEVDLDEAAFARYDPEAGWATDAGEYVVEVGRSSRDARSTVGIKR
jgi:beta-glucosidase